MTRERSFSFDPYSSGSAELEADADFVRKTIQDKGEM